MEFNKSLGESVVFMVVLPYIDVGFHGSKKDFESFKQKPCQVVFSTRRLRFVMQPDIFCTHA